MDTELRERIKDFWLELGEQEHRNLVNIQKNAVLKVMMKQMEHSCACAVCQKKRRSMEKELEALYDAYYEELEQYANCEGRDGWFNIRNSSLILTQPGNILTVADDLLNNNGQKFLEMMEQLSEHRMQREEEEANGVEDESDEESDEDRGSEAAEDGEDDAGRIENERDEEKVRNDEEVQERITEEQMMLENKRIFSIFATHMLEQRLVPAYREKVGRERHLQLLRRLNREDKSKPTAA